MVRAEKLPKAAAEKPARAEGEIRHAARLMGRFLAGQRWQFVMALLMLIAEAWSATRIPLILGFLIDYLTPRIAFLKGQSTTQPLSPLQMLGLPTIYNPDIDTIALVTIGVVLLTIVNSLTDSLAEIYLAKGGMMLSFNLRVGLYSHLQKLSLAFYSKQRTGDLLTRVTGDVQAIEQFVVKSLSDIVGSFLLIGFILYTMIVGAWQVAVIAVLIIPIMVVISNYFSQLVKSVSKKQRAREGELASAAQEMLTSIRVIQTYGSGGNELKRFSDQSRKTMDASLEAARLQALFSGVVSVLESVAVAVIVWLAVYLIFGTVTVANGFGIGLLTVFTKYIADMFKPTKKIIKEWNTFGKIYASVERIGDLMDRKPAVEDVPNALPAPRLKGQIEYRNVSFAYQSEDEGEGKKEAELRLALRDVSLSIAPGEVLALVGGSGAGKSTIVQLLPRLYDPHAGAITIDGMDIRSFTLESLRAQMSMVLQESILFTGTVADNIAYGRPEATREEVIAAAIQANAHEFIEKLPDGYDTVLGERASTLSGGQRQRLAIARAFIRNTSILILDEPTTGLDAESTELVLLALRELMKGKSTIIISHDLNLIRHADKIVVIKLGEIAQVGTHKELLRSGGLYADLYKKQFGKAVEEQGGQLKPAIPAPIPAVDDEDEEEANTVTPKVFQTLISQALPQPVSHKAFATLMHQAVPVPAPAEPVRQAVGAPAQPVAAASHTPARPVAPPPAAAQPAPAAPAAQPQPAPARPVAPPPAAAQPAPAASATQAQPAPADPPKPAIYATTVMRTIPPAPQPDAPKQSPKPTLLLSRDELLAAESRLGAAADGQPQGAGQRPEGAQLEPLASPALQRELPSVKTAFDSEAMKGYLQVALFGKAHPRYTIASCEPDQAAYLAGGDFILRYELEIQDQTGGAALHPLVNARIFRDQLACAVYMRDKLVPLAALVGQREELAPFVAPVAMIEPLNMAVHAFPIDGEMPTLVGATDRQRVADVLRETLPEALDNSLTIERCRVELVDYARQHRAVLRYHVEGRRGNRPDQRIIYGKVFADSSGALTGSVTAALRERVLGSNGAYRINVPQTFGWRPDLQLSLLEAIPGEPPIADMLKARLRGKPAEPRALSLEQMIDDCGRIAAMIHTPNLKLGRRRNLDDEMAALGQELSHVQRFSPELGAYLQDRLEQLRAYAEQSDPLRLCFSHGDFTHGQIMFDGATPGLVDFDSVCQAEPALDLGQFLAYLRVADKRKDGADGKSELIEQLGERFLSAYIASMGDQLDDPERLRARVSIYKVVSLTRRVLRSWQKFKGSRVENAIAVLEEEIACLPQLDY